MKKSFLLILVIVFICGMSVMAAPKTTTISFWFQSQNKLMDSYFADAIKAFEKTHPQIKVEITTLPQAQADQDLKLNAALLSGTYPDVLSAMLSQIATRGPKGDFYPLDKLVNSWNEKSDIFESVYNLGQVKGKLLGLGYYPNPDVLTYRKDFFKEAGLNPEKPPANWDELAAYAKKLTVRDDKDNVVRAGLDIPALNSSTFVKQLARQNGALVIDNKKAKPMLDDAALISTYDYIMNLKNAHVSIPYDYVKKDTTPFIYGKSAMSFLQPSQIMTMLTNDPSLKEKIGVAPVLTQKKKIGWCGFRLFAIGNESKYKKEAWELIKFLMSKEQMELRMRTLKMPVVRKSLEDDYAAADPRMNKAILDYVKYGQGDDTVPWNTMATKFIHLSYEEAYSGKKAPAQALKDAQVALVKELKNSR